MEAKKSTPIQSRANELPKEQEEALRRKQAFRMNSYVKNLNALLKGKEQKKEVPD